MTYFNSSSSVGDTRCFEFQPVQDMIIEGNEGMPFQALPEYERDMFVDAVNSFALTIIDDDGNNNCIIIGILFGH